MSTSGIGPSPALIEAFSNAVDSGAIRFLKILISNESLVHDCSTPPSGTFEDDLAQLNDLLQDDVPAYVLARFDDPSSDWLVIFYVPESAKVRDKMLYASTRNSVTKSLGSTHFTDSIFATTKADLTPEAYAKHKLHLAAPKPLSAREKELADLAAAEKESGGSAYQGSTARLNHLGTGVGLIWSKEAEDALKHLATDSSSRLLIISIDPPSETLILSNYYSIERVDTLGSNLPSADPAYAFFGWAHVSGERKIVFIYSCPSSSPIKHRMLYSSGSSSVFQTAKALLSSSGDISLAGRKIETSDPNELNEAFLKSKLGFSDAAATSPLTEQQVKPFARPRGPARKR